MITVLIERVDELPHSDSEMKESDDSSNSHEFGGQGGKGQTIVPEMQCKMIFDSPVGTSIRMPHRIETTMHKLIELTRIRFHIRVGS